MHGGQIHTEWPRHVRFLVTGAAGFIGSHLCEQLITEGHSVIGVDAFIDAYPRLHKERNLRALLGSPAFEFHEKDLRTADLDSLVNGCDVIINEAAMAGLTRSWTDFDLYSSCNLLAVSRLVESATKSGIERFVQISTSSVYGREAVGDESGATRPISPYGVTKLAAEHLLWAHEARGALSLLVLRYFSVYGPRQRPDMALRIFTEAMIRGEPITVFGDGSQSRTNTYVSDIVRGTIDGATSDVVGTFNLSGRVAISVTDAIRLISDALGATPDIRHAAERPGDQQQTAGSSERAMEAFGFKPTVDPAEGIARQVSWTVAEVAGD